MKKPLSIIAFIFLVLAIGNVIFYCTTDVYIAELFFNSDSLYLPTLFSDLLAEGGKLSDWFLTPAPYFFPDYPMYFLAYMIGTSTFSQIMAFTIIQLILSVFVCWFLARQVLQNNAFITAVAIVTGLIWFALFSPMSAFPFILVSGHHHGIFISAILCVALWLRYESSQDSSRSLLLFLICATAFLSTLSDSLFIVQFTIPFTAAIIWYDILTRKISLRRLLLTATPALASSLGAYSYKYFVFYRTRYPHEIGLEYVHDSVLQIASFFETVIRVHPIYSIILLGYAGVIVYLSLFSFRNAKTDSPTRKLAWLATFSVFSFCCTIIATSLVQHPPVSARYFLPAFSWPIIILLLYLEQHYRQYSGIGGVVVSGITVALLTISSITYEADKDAWVGFHPSELACIDEALTRADASNGIAGYWDAKRLKMQSTRRLNVAQFNKELKEFYWITSKRFFKDSYDFAVIDKRFPDAPLEELLMRVGGQPEAVLQCGSKSLYLYGKDGLLVRKITSKRSVYQWQASELPTRIGILADGGKLKKQNIAESGCLTYGPHEALPAGTYLFEITYSSPESSEVLVGKWDAGLVPIKKIKFREGHLRGTNGKLDTIRGYFTISPRHHLKKLEIRTFSFKNTDLSLAHVRIKKIK